MYVWMAAICHLYLYLDCFPTSFLYNRMFSFFRHINLYQSKNNQPLLSLLHPHLPFCLLVNVASACDHLVLELTWNCQARHRTNQTFTISKRHMIRCTLTCLGKTKNCIPVECPPENPTGHFAVGRWPSSVCTRNILLPLLDCGKSLGISGFRQVVHMTEGLLTCPLTVSLPFPLSSGVCVGTHRRGWSFFLRVCLLWMIQLGLPPAPPKKIGSLHLFLTAYT